MTEEEFTQKSVVDIAAMPSEVFKGFCRDQAVVDLTVDDKTKVDAGPLVNDEPFRFSRIVEL